MVLNALVSERETHVHRAIELETNDAKRLKLCLAICKFFLNSDRIETSGENRYIVLTYANFFDVSLTFRIKLRNFQQMLPKK